MRKPLPWLLIPADSRAYPSLPSASEHLPPSPRHHAHLYRHMAANQAHHQQQMGDMDPSTIPVAGGRSPFPLLRDNSLSYPQSPLCRADRGVAWEAVRVVGRKESPLLPSVIEVLHHHSSRTLHCLVEDRYDQAQGFHRQKRPLLTRKCRVHRFEATPTCQIDHSHLRGG